MAPVNLVRDANGLLDREDERKGWKLGNWKN